MVDVGLVIQSVVKSGRAFYGAEQAINAARFGRAVALIVANDCPQEIRKDVEQYEVLSGIPIFQFRGSSRDLGGACRKPFRVSVLAVREILETDLALAVKESIRKATDSQTQI